MLRTRYIDPHNAMTLILMEDNPRALRQGTTVITSIEWFMFLRAVIYTVCPVFILVGYEFPDVLRFAYLLGRAFLIIMLRIVSIDEGKYGFIIK